ncbi:hypothetical protein [Burkholderia vietnamiensis]|uniref:Uncharacterized protein n=1 Tax=Burkholderia vietnamiensis TaxID=60552 RepID=A0AAW7SY03_BURVI|nr:hypothetical protein [Burkholderia vietnamiensis]MDN7794837.1 hypothetical protein [Burkholderia vietnamiensis]HDR9073175.1 hypothetical protein [Burkholderia vietnamiensis]HDR9190937.1 hypothetical protein [Burkholderia vietnamiensis]HDR9242042.1 hypothetical protein [Burkholderia vietnamiensis]
MKEKETMETRRLFEGRNLPIVKNDIGMISIDTIERQWDLVNCDRDANRMVLVSRSRDIVVVGKMAIRDDGKFCLVFEIWATIDPNLSLREMRQWHMDRCEYQARLAELQHALKANGYLA